MVRQVKSSDASDISLIYNEYVLSSTSTFEESAVTDEDIRNRIKNITHRYPWLVYEENGTIIGYTYAGKWKERSAYRYTVETGIYIDSNHTDKGIGTKLMRALLDELKNTSVHSVICGIALPNPASVALCEKLAFNKVAHFKEAGFKHDQWIDVGYWERIL